MSEFDKLIPTNEIPLEKAAAYFIVLKEASIDGGIEQAQEFEKLAASLTKEEAQEQVRRGIQSGIRSTVAGDISHAARLQRTRGERVGKEVGTGGGALAGFLASRGKRPMVRAASTAIGALMGRGAGKEIGREADVKKLRQKMKPSEKRGEMEKYTGTEKAAGVSFVRELWKLAQGAEMTDPVAGQAGAAASPEPVEFQGFQEEPPAKGGKQQAAPRQPNQGGAPTPEDLERAAAEEQLALEAAADQEAQLNEAEHYRQIAEEATAAAEQMSAQLQQAQAGMEQASQQAQMSQMQADQATMQATQQAQADAQEKQMLSQQAIGQQDLNMRMRQAMQNYRESLQQIALQDPTAEADAMQQMQQPMAGSPEEQMMAEQGQPPEAGAEPGAEPGAEVPEMLAEEPAPPKKPEKKEEKGKGGVTVNVEKTSGVRTTGALIGAGLGAGLQAATDRGKGGGPSAKETWLRHKVEAMERRPNKGAFDKHMINITRAMAEAAKINREHPGAAAATAGATGAIVGAAAGPNISRALKALRR